MRIAIGGIRGIPARYGGFETSAEQTALRLQRLGHAVTVYCRRQGKEHAEPGCSGVQLIHLKALGPSFVKTISHSFAIGLHVAIHKSDVDVVHMYNAASAFGGLIVRMIGKPLVITLDGVEWKRDKWGRLARGIWKMATWLSVRVANAVVCDSQSVRAVFEERYGANMKYIPYGAQCLLDSGESAYRSFGLERRKYFIFVGRLVPEKGVDVLLEAYRLLKTQIPLVIVGDNENDPRYVQQLRQRADSNVLFVGYRYGNEYENLLSNAQLYVTASRLEGTSPSLLAAMGARICCVVNEIPENRETGGDSVVYFNGSVEDLAQKWHMLLERPEIMSHYARKAHNRVRRQYDWDAVTRAYLAAYHGVCGVQSPASDELGYDEDGDEAFPHKVTAVGMSSHGTAG